MSRWRVLLLLVLPVLAACSEAVPPTAFLSFAETEPGGEPYPVRMLVTEKFLRIEDGDGQDGFVLLDRAARTLYSVNHAARTTLVVRAEPVKLAAPARFEHKAERDPAALPDVGGEKVVHYRLLTNGENCFEVYAADGLLPQALAALREYHETLAGEQAAMQANIPAAFQSACDLADHVFLPARHLAHGFPVRQVNRAGRVRQLIDYKTGVPVDAKLLQLPKDYKQITPANLRK
jgi:hypothetical protein